MRNLAREHGFSMLELVTVVAITGVIVAVALPSSTRTVADYRLRGDARAVHNMIGVAKMRAAARFTRVRMRADFPTDSFYMQYWDKTAGAWVTEGGTTTLSTGIGFDTHTMAAPPPNTQAALGQAASCLDDAAQPIANTGCIVFNSRGIPIDGNGAPDGNGAFYLTDWETGVYGVTLSATPLVRLWWSPAYVTAWIQK
jgi:prepilin-type N-terminal cleavage/methylation domain-containing protein